MLTDELDRLVSDYEYRWRAAWLEGRRQFRGEACGGDGIVIGDACAWTVVRDERAALAFAVRVDWRCPECGWRAVLLPQVMIHLNNCHKWDWIALSFKFRDMLEEGMEVFRG